MTNNVTCVRLKVGTKCLPGSGLRNQAVVGSWLYLKLRCKSLQSKEAEISEQVAQMLKVTKGLIGMCRTVPM